MTTGATEVEAAKAAAEREAREKTAADADARAIAARMQAALAALTNVATLAADASTALKTLMAPAGPSTADEKEVTEHGFFAPYAEFAKTLRTWYVAYGIGGPVLMLSQERVATAVLGSGAARTIVIAFLAGVGLQIVQAVVYKIAMWNLYMAELDPKLSKLLRTRVSDFISESLTIEVFFDLITLALFAYATVKLFVVVTGALPPSATPPLFRFTAPTS